MLAAIVDKNGMCCWSDIAAAQTHIRQAHEDRIAAMESVLRGISRRHIVNSKTAIRATALTALAVTAVGGQPGGGQPGLKATKYRYRLQWLKGGTLPDGGKLVWWRCSACNALFSDADKAWRQSEPRPSDDLAIVVG